MPKVVLPPSSSFVCILEFLSILLLLFFVLLRAQAELVLHYLLVLLSPFNDIVIVSVCVHVCASHLRLKKEEESSLCYCFSWSYTHTHAEKVTDRIKD